MKNAVLITLVSVFVFSCGSGARKSGPTQGGLQEYVRQARTPPPLAPGPGEGSLWTDAGNRADLFRDLKAYRVADIVTIAVVESTSAVSQASTDRSKTNEVGAGAPSFFGLEKRIGELTGLLDTTRSSDFQGDGTTSRRTTLNTSITSRVIEVFPNENLLVEGNREILINGERQIVIVRGVIRPADISPQNIVPSTAVAELEIRVDGRGIVSSAQEPGILAKIFAGFWPF